LQAPILRKPNAAPRFATSRSDNRKPTSDMTLDQGRSIPRRSDTRPTFQERKRRGSPGRSDSADTRCRRARGRRALMDRCAASRHGLGAALRRRQGRLCSAAPAARDRSGSAKGSAKQTFHARTTLPRLRCSARCRAEARSALLRRSSIAFLASWTVLASPGVFTAAIGAGRPGAIAPYNQEARDAGQGPSLNSPRVSRRRARHHPWLAVAGACHHAGRDTTRRRQDAHACRCAANLSCRRRT